MGVHAVSNSPSATTVIVGAGQAGSELAFELRRLGAGGRILLLGSEPHLPYQRPPLSKAVLAGEMLPHALTLKAASAYEKMGIEVRLGAQAQAIDRGGKTIELAGGERLDYDGLALTLGGSVRRLRVPGHDLGGIHYLRTLDDVAGLRESFAPGKRLVIVGGGYVGLEVASVALKQGLRVTVLESASRVLARVAAPDISAFYEEMHREAGVAIRTDSTVVNFRGSGSGVDTVTCGDGEELPADIVLVGIGLIPNTALAEECGLSVDDGIVVDAFCRTADPHIVAAGDCVRFHSGFLERWTRLESVPNAIEQAKTAAAALCGIERPYTAAPWFWSDQFSLKLQMVGIAQDHDRTVLRGSVASRSFISFYFKNGVLIAADAVNRPAEFMITRRLVEARASVAPELLADETRPLRALLDTKVVA
jgi:3-phenylpropionate/trans-cinnamate dioxygenase ferredoxin reductase subunit